MPGRALLIEQFVHDERILPRTRIEGFLLVALGVKPLSLITIPGELPEGDQLGWQIDNHYRNQLQQLESAGLWERLQWQLRHLGQRPVTWKMEMVRNAYQQVVEGSATYQAHLQWAEAFGLKTFFWEVRPAVRELYLYKSPSVEDELNELMVERVRIRDEMRKNATKDTPLPLLVYPEEQSPDYLAKLGRLLGYPPCCIQAYRSNRAEDINVETRAAGELDEAEFQGELPWAYFVKNFFPCSPQCEQATGLAKHAYHELNAISSELGVTYSKLLEENREMVRHYPEAIHRHMRTVSDRGKSFFRGV
jgi:hypothetical protein